MLWYFLTNSTVGFLCQQKKNMSSSSSSSSSDTGLDSIDEESSLCQRFKQQHAGASVVCLIIGSQSFYLDVDDVLRYPTLMLSKMLDPASQFHALPPADTEGVITIRSFRCRDPVVFQYVARFYRTGQLDCFHKEIFSMLTIQRDSLTKELNFWGLAETASIASLSTHTQSECVEVYEYNTRKLNWLLVDDNAPTEKHVANWVQNLLLPETLAVLMTKNKSVQRKFTIIIQDPISISSRLCIVYTTSWVSLLDETIEWSSITYNLLHFDLTRLLRLPRRSSGVVSKDHRDLIQAFLSVWMAGRLYGGELFRANLLMQQECIRLLAVHGFTASFTLESYTCKADKTGAFRTNDAMLFSGITFPLLLDTWDSTEFPEFIHYMANTDTADFHCTCLTLTLFW